MTRKVPFGNAMRETHFQFSPSYTPLNHGSYGAFPSSVQATQNSFQKLAAERPDAFIVRDLPSLIDKSRSAIAPLLGAETDEVVFVPNATTGVNVVLRNLKWIEGDVIVFFSTVYPACEKSVASVGEVLPLQPVCIQLDYPVEDEQIIAKFRECIERVRAEGKNVRIAMFDTILTFPGARMPWEDLVGVCKELGVLSLVDGAHGVGSIDLTHLASVNPDFFVSNCHKWLYTPRGCAVFYVPYRNQHLIRTSIPTGWGYQYLSDPPQPSGKSPFVYLFEFVATIDYTPYVCVPAALEFRTTVCGGEAAIQKYCFEIAREGGKRVAEILGTEVMDNKTKTMSQCCFANVAFPFSFKGPGVESEGAIDVSEASKIARWINDTAVKEFDTYLQVAFYLGRLWVRLSGQIYLELENFEWVGHKLKELCGRVERGEFRDEGSQAVQG